MEECERRDRERRNWNKVKKGERKRKLELLDWDEEKKLKEVIELKRIERKRGEKGGEVQKERVRSKNRGGN